MDEATQNGPPAAATGSRPETGGSPRRLAVMYSGGTDSTATVALLAEQYDEVFLLTCTHSGLRFVEYSERNIPRLRERFPKVRFHHVYLEMDALWRRVTYERYWSNLRRHGFMTLTTCGLCKVAMHLRAMVHCIDNGITEIADGANHNMSHSPEQMQEVLAEMRRLYARFGIAYTSPVYDYDFPRDIDWLHKLGLPAVTGPAADDAPRFGRTTGKVLLEAGLAPEANVKGTEYDRRMQARCFQLTLLNVAALGWYIPREGMEKYRERVRTFYREKIAVFGNQVDQYVRDPDRSALHALLSRPEAAPRIGIGPA